MLGFHIYFICFIFTYIPSFCLNCLATAPLQPFSVILLWKYIFCLHSPELPGISSFAGRYLIMYSFNNKYIIIINILSYLTVHKSFSWELQTFHFKSLLCPEKEEFSWVASLLWMVTTLLKPAKSSLLSEEGCRWWVDGMLSHLREVLDPGKPSSSCNSKGSLVQKERLLYWG